MFVHDTCPNTIHDCVCHEACSYMTLALILYIYIYSVRQFKINKLVLLITNCTPLARNFAHSALVNSCVGFRDTNALPMKLDTRVHHIHIQISVYTHDIMSPSH